MRVMAQLAMVMNLDKCIGCHTCSVTCKQAPAWAIRADTRTKTLGKVVGFATARAG